jgi:signal transduction histidine kinase
VTAATDNENCADASRAEAGPDIQALAQALRKLATNAADQTAGGLSLVFAAAPGDESADSAARLRAAAGFTSPHAAREVAEQLHADVRDAIASQATAMLSPLPSLGARSAAGLEIHPLIFGDKAHGALVVGLGAALDSAQRAALETVIEHLALRLDHASLKHEDEPSAATTDGDGDQNEEILKLSEALFAQDIELLRSNEKLGKIEKLKNDFIEKMSRELRTPLNSIIEGIISVLTGENDNLSDGAKQTLRLALDDGSAFLRNLQNILDLWRIKQNELPVEIHDMNFREMVEEAIFSVQDAIGDKPISLEQHILEPFPKIRTDLTKVNQVLFLLLDNAAKFTPEGRIEIRASVEDQDLVCEVRDTGIGICPDDQQFIFDEFFQVDVASSQTYSGAGLGLALVKDLITLLDGEVAVSSDVGRGTSVSFRIPVQVAG